MPEVSQDITAVLAALNLRDSRREALRALTDSQWKGLLSSWRILHLMIPLRQACGDDLPEWVRSQIDQNLVSNAERFRNIQAVYSEFSDALRAKNLEHLVIKGFAQSPDFVEHPNLRFQGDIDVYCPPESIFPVRDALFALGYQPVKGMELPSCDHLPAMIRETDWKWRGNFYDPEMPLVFELHFCFWNEKKMRFAPTGLDLFWARRIQRRLGDFSFTALAPLDNLGYIALHVLRDLLGGERIAYNVFELARYLHTNAQNELLWKNWQESHDDSLRSLEAISFRLASEWFSCALPQQVEREIDRLPGPVQSWFETCGGQHPGRPWIRPNKARLWLQLSLVESWRDKTAIFVQELFPTRMPSVETVNTLASVLDEQPNRRTPLQQRTYHAAYIISRAAYHASILPSTLWQGLSWWFASKQVNKRFWTFLSASLLFGLGLAIFFFLYNLYLVDLGFKESFLGLVATSMSVGTLAGTIPAGILTQRFGLRKTLFLGFVLMAIISALRCLVVSPTSLLFLAFLAGAVFSIWAVSISPAIAQLTSERSRSFGFSIVFSSGMAIGFLGGLTGGFLPGWLAHLSPRFTAVHAKQGALLIAAAIEVLALWPVSRLRFVATPAPETKIFARNPFLLRFLPAIAAWSLVVGAFGPFVNVYFTQHLRLSLKQAGMVFSISQISSVVAVLAAPAIFRKFGLVTGIMYTQIATAIALGFLALVPGASSAAIIYILYAAFLWMGEPGMYSMLMNKVPPAERSGASALNFLAISLAQALAAALTGAAFVRFGYPAVLGTIAAVALVAACVFRVLLGKFSVPAPRPAEDQPQRPIPA